LEMKSQRQVTRDKGQEINKRNSYPVNPLNPVDPVEKKMSDTTEIVTRLFGWSVTLLPFLKKGSEKKHPLRGAVAEPHTSSLKPHASSLQRSPVRYITGPPSGTSAVPRPVFHRSDGRPRAVGRVVHKTGSGERNLLISLKTKGGKKFFSLRGGESRRCLMV
jgi:hypothetical protein